MKVFQTSLPACQRLSAVAMTLALSLSVLTGGNTLADEAPANPLQQLFGQFDDGLKNWAKEIEIAQQQRDQVDIRPQQRPDDVRRLTQVKRLIRQENWLEVVQVLQTILEQPNDAFLINEERKFESIAELVEQIIRDLPPNGQRAYHNLFDAAARNAFDLAWENRDEAALQEVLQRFPLTPAANQSAKVLIQLQADRGEFSAAARLSLRLERMVPADDQPKTRQQTLFLFARAGDRQQIAKLGADALNDKVLQGIVESSLNGFLTPVSRKAISPTELSLGWTQSLIKRYSVKEQIDKLRSDLKHNLHERALIPTIAPLLVDGLVVTKRLDGLAAYQTKTGEVAWSTGSDDVEERLTQATGGAESSTLVDEIRPYDSEALDFHPLASLLFRDSLWPSLSTDGRRIYSIENNTVIDSTTIGNTWQSWSRQDDAERELWMSNELVARRVDTGEVVWKLGGPVLEDRFSRRMAGTYFLGAPTIHNSELLVLGERDGEVVLFALAAYSGDLLWSQPLVTPGIAINENIVRRFWNCQPVLQDGIIVCPTGSGWLMGVDHTTHRLLWTLRFPIRTDHLEHFRRGPATPSLLDLNQRWSNPGIVVEGQTVLFTPPELPDEFGLTNPFLIAVDLESGKQLWKVSKQQGLYLAGIHNKSAIVVGEKWIEAYMLEREGATLWKTSLSSHGIPSGMGMFNGNQYLLPVNDTTLLTIDLQTGDVSQVQDLSYCGDQLGNLLAYEDSILAASPESLLTLVSKADAPNPNSWNVVKRDVEKMLGAGQTADALSALDKATVSEIEKTDFDRVQWNALTTHIQKQLGQPDLPFKELKQLADSPKRTAQYLGLWADHQTELKNWDAATEAYVQLLNQPEPPMINEPPRQVRADAWARGKLLNLIETISDDQKALREIILAKFPPADESNLNTTQIEAYPSATWGDAWTVTRGGSSELNLQELDVFGTPYKSFRFRYNPNHNQLRIENASDGGLHWLLTLRSFDTLQEQPTANVTMIGSKAYILHRGVLHAFDVQERKTLWTHVPSVNALNATRLRSPYHNHDKRLNNRSVVLATDRMRNKETGYFLAATPNVVLVHYNKLTGLDAKTGEILWQDESVPANATATVLGDHFVLMNRSQHALIRDFDGMSIEHPLLDYDLDEALDLDQSSITLFEETEGKSFQLRHVNIEDATELWKVDLPARTTFRRTSPNELCWLQPDGALKLCHVKTGDVREIGTVPEQALRNARESSLLKDQAGNVFLTFDKGNEGGDYSRIPSIRANGGVFCFADGKTWSVSTSEFSRDFDDQHTEGVEDFPTSWTLLTQDFEHSPLLVFVSSKPQRDDGLHYRMLHMIAIDKQSGETVLTWGRASDSGGFSYFGVDLAQKQILLTTYNENLLIRPGQD